MQEFRLVPVGYHYDIYNREECVKALEEMQDRGEFAGQREGENYWDFGELGDGELMWYWDNWVMPNRDNEEE